MVVIHIYEVKKIPGRPYSINLKGSIGHNNFDADLEGVCLNIKSASPLSDEQFQKLENELNELFLPPLDGRFKKKDIEKVLSDNNGVISIKV